VLSVNGQSLVNVDHYDAVEVLKRSGYKLVLVVTREVPRLVPVTTKVCHSDFLVTAVTAGCLFSHVFVCPPIWIPFKL
jgi:hypothetical protein